MSDFSIRRDWKKINWKATFQFNVFRSICATPVWLLLVLLVNKHFVWQMILFPIVYFAFWLPFGLFCGWLSRIGVPFAGLLSIFSSLVIVVGDPVVWTIHKIKPDLVPIAEPKFLDFHLITFATNEPETIPLCNYEGRIVADENINFMGEVFPIRKTLFIIKPDWSVETLKDQYFGFVDIQGAIKKGRLQKGIDPRETAIGEMIAYIGHDGVCYNPQQQRLGQYDTMPAVESERSEKEVYLEGMVDKINEIEKYRRLKRADFPPEQNLCELAGQVYAYKGISFLNTTWDENEVIFDINLLGEVKTPYHSDFGSVQGTGEIVQGDEDSGQVVAKIMGSYCYANNQKIGQFIVQTD